MRTTLNLDDEVLRAVKREAAESGRTMTEVIDEALRELLMRDRKPSRPFRLEMVTVRGTKRPGVDLADRDSLYDLMESRS